MQHTGGGDRPLGPIDPLLVPRFAGPATYARLPRLDQVDRCDVAIVGVPFDGGVTYRPGARFGPARDPAGSRLLRRYNPALDVEPFASQQVADAGDIACNPFDIDEAIVADRAPARGSCWRASERVHRARRRPHDRAAAAAGGARRGTARSRSCTSTRTSTPGTRTSARRVHARHAVPPRARGRPARAGPLVPTSGSADRCSRRRTWSTTPGSGSRSWAAFDYLTRIGGVGGRRAPRARRRHAGLRLDRHRRARSRARPGHGHPRGRRDDQPGAARDAARRWPGSTSSAPTSSRWRPPTTTPRSPRSRPRTSVYELLGMFARR